ncbi:uncharacterized protein LOC127444134 [Myxocyprinus asiaticus]|uniref:uncharacterized protein LOC127444134 n=1 Tax=Myxocyprinus asiaticus TaxID=70543 RepID=UPI00222378FF|nr:uncharacterized protein LOC127444134 [Myxocyprinus asiaticus]
MERERVILFTLVCIWFCEHQRVFGAEVDIKVKPGDNITLFCDCAIPIGSQIIWIRNCSHENQPSLFIRFDGLFKGIFPRYSFVPNNSSNSYDLHIKNTSVSDEGIYHCAKAEKNIEEDALGIIRSKEKYQYGNRTTRLSLLEPASTTVSPSPVSDCLLCWQLLFSVCPVCVLLCSICAYCLCQKKNTGPDSRAFSEEKAETQTFNQHDEGEDEVCYASLDMPSKRQKQLKKKRLQGSDFSTYSEVRTKRS